MFDPNFQHERRGTQIKFKVHAERNKRLQVTASCGASAGHAGIHRQTVDDLVEGANRCLDRAKARDCGLGDDADSRDEKLLMEAKIVRVQITDGATGSNRSAKAEAIA